MKLFAQHAILGIFVQTLGLNVIRRTGINVIDISNCVCVFEWAPLCLFSKSHFGFERTGQSWRETKWGRKSGSCLWHCICMDACFVCALWWVSLDEAACPKGVQSVLVSETVRGEIRTRGVRMGLGECGNAKLV